MLKWGFLHYFLTTLPNYHFFYITKSFFYIGGIGGGIFKIYKGVGNFGNLVRTVRTAVFKPLVLAFLFAK